jgi:NAD-dependent DNA ligase
LKTLDGSDLESMIQTANDLYYNSLFSTKYSPLTDSQYDILVNFFHSNYSSAKKIGAPVTSKVKLPYFMGSMDKIKPDTNALNNWKMKHSGPYIVSSKLDGISGLFTINSKGIPHLYTRGDGDYGQDISNIIPYLKLPVFKEPTAVRGEFIIKKKFFKINIPNNFQIQEILLLDY